MLSLMLFFASRDPARNVAIVNAFIVGLCVLAITPLLSFYTLDLRRLSWIRDLGALTDTIGAGSTALLSAAARHPWRAILEGKEGLDFGGSRTDVRRLED